MTTERIGEQGSKQDPLRKIVVGNYDSPQGIDQIKKVFAMGGESAGILVGRVNVSALVEEDLAAVHAEKVKTVR